MPNPSDKQRQGLFGKRPRAWRCPHCIEAFKRDRIPRHCMFDSRDKSFVGDHWRCGSQELLRFAMIRQGVHLIEEERESMTTARWMTITDTEKLLVVWRRGRPRILMACITGPNGVRPLTWTDFCMVASQNNFDGYDPADVAKTAWARDWREETVGGPSDGRLVETE